MSIFAPWRRGEAVAPRLPQAHKHDIQPDSILDEK
ncbi:hypothetical protein ABIA36_000286 [Leifsonia sp. EB34]